MNNPLRRPLTKAFLAISSAAASLAPIASLVAQEVARCGPAGERAGDEFGCFMSGRLELGHLPSRPRLYWHIDRYATASAAQADRGPRGMVIQSFGRNWLFTIAPADWRPAGGQREARIGPLPLVRAATYSAVYMEGAFHPGMHTPVHRHPGVEAWYTIEGEMCLETPEGTIHQRAGDPGKMVRAGLPMMLTGVGTGPRRSVVLILQDSSKQTSVPAPDWTPKGRCTV